jgi:hypothetical protein
MSELNARIRDLRLPDRMKHLPVSAKGFPVPWFVTWFDAAGRPMPVGQGTPDFRCIDPDKIVAAHRRELCWICGAPRGANMAFAVGPMCVVNRISSEPPAHLGCALYAVRACPFLAQPRMTRNDKGLPAHTSVEGMIEHNPGATAVYVTRSYKIAPVRNGVLFRMGEPRDVTWWREGREATREEVLTAIEKGMPALTVVMANNDQLDQLPGLLKRAQELVPAC